MKVPDICESQHDYNNTMIIVNLNCLHENKIANTISCIININVIDYTEVPSLDNNWLYGMQVMNTLF